MHAHSVHSGGVHRTLYGLGRRLFRGALASAAAGIMTVPLSSAEWHPVLWLAIFCLPLLGLVMVFSCIPRRRIEIGEIRLGNPLLRGDVLPLPSTAQLAPLAHLCRTLGDSELRPLVIG